MSALPITITISVNEHTPPHQLRAIQELLGFAVNPVAPSGNGAAGAINTADRLLQTLDKAIPPAPVAALSQHAEAVIPAIPAAPIGPVIPAQVAVAAAPAAGEKTPGKRGRQPSTPEEKAAAEQGGFKNVTEYRKHQAAKMLAAMQSALATPQAPASVADALRSKDPGALAAVAAQPPAEPVRSILRDQPGPGGTVYAEAAMPTAIPAMPTGNGATPAPAPAATASEWDKAADSDPYVSAQAVWDQLNALKPGASWFTLRNIFPQHSDVHSVPMAYVGDVKKALQAKIDELQPRAA